MYATSRDLVNDHEKKTQNKEMSQNYLDEDINAPGEKMVIYQIMTRLFGNKFKTNREYGTREENGVGKFAYINDAALNSLKELGTTHIWYTGIKEHALMADYRENGIAIDDAEVVKGRAGSPYAIKDYYDGNPDLAENVNNRMQEFEDLVKITHAHDLNVLIDFKVSPLPLMNNFN
ncbi:hypothetical protein BH23BAC1_BH23BAC1_18300 [soil metagenome]